VLIPHPSVLAYEVPEPSSRFRLKVATIPAIPVSGVRVTRWAAEGGPGAGSGGPYNTRFVVLSDPRTGFPLAVIDEHWTYNLRTSAAGMAAVRLLARPESRVVGLVGAGQIATTCAEMVSRMFRLQEVRVTSRRPETRQAFAARMSEQLGVRFEARDTVEETVRDADIVITASSANAVLIHDIGWLAPGSTICGLGTGEVSAQVYNAADKAIVSDYEVVQELPDVRGLLASGQVARETIWSDVAEIVAGSKTGRTSPDERIFVRAGGLVSQDVALCHLVYTRALERGLGTAFPVG
jgi:ornithine cyclodeaminase